MKMTLTKEFKEGMMFPKHLKNDSAIYKSPKKANTVKIAWEKTGKQLKKAIVQYDRESKEK